MRPARIAAALTLARASCPAHASWTKTDTTLAAASTALLLVDWAQTQQIAAEPRWHHERNPVLGSHPSMRTVNTYMGACLAANLLIPPLLPKPLRHAWYAGMIGVEVYAVRNNYGTGLAIRLPFP